MGVVVDNGMLVVCVRFSVYCVLFGLIGIGIYVCVVILSCWSCVVVISVLLLLLLGLIVN